MEIRLWIFFFPVSSVQTITLMVFRESHLVCRDPFHVVELKARNTEKLKVLKCWSTLPRLVIMVKMVISYLYILGTFMCKGFMNIQNYDY